MNALLNDLLNLSRLGRVMNPPVEVSMAELVNEVLALLSPPITKRGVQVTVMPGLPVVQGDRLRLLEVMQNLLENAIKFMGDQTDPRIDVGLVQRGEEQVFYVRDNGMGIAADYHTKVFGLFDKLHAGMEGSGAGLAIVKRIIEVHGGRIWVESAGVGQGSTFFFTLGAPSP